MARVLVTSGPTRQYLDPVRFLTNGSTGRMGQALCQALQDGGHQVVVVSGPVEVAYPDGVEVVAVVTTEEMLSACQGLLPACDGVVGVAAPCDYRVEHVAERKIAKTGQPLLLRLVETPDILATLGEHKGDRWMVGFALETDDRRFRALAKLERKKCDLMILNSPQAISSVDTRVEILDPAGDVVAAIAGDKRSVAARIVAEIEHRLVRRG
jgi:phosphopantothenoylcysteine decarboxylase/phosphopantothenate--cysteine ligase